MVARATPMPAAKKTAAAAPAMSHASGLRGITEVFEDTKSSWEESPLWNA
jgi:hypothetical protein